MVEGKKESSNSFLDKSIDFIFSNDIRKWLILIVLLGFILRVIVASHVPPVADESGSMAHAIGYSKLAPLSGIAQAQVWFYLTDYLFRLFTVNLLMGRFLSVLLGTLSILIVYLIGNLLFNKKTGMIAAFLLAISAFHITWAASYQDQTMMFFVLLASYFFIKEYHENKRISILSAVFLGIAELVKIITGVFIVVFVAFSLFILYRNYKSDKKLFKNNFKRAIVCLIILIVSLLPIIAHNYFLYKAKGIVDLPLAQFLRINPEFYIGPGLHHEEGFVVNKLLHNLYTVITLYFIHEDPLTSLVGVLGIILLLSSIKKRKFGELFLIVMFFFLLLFLASSIVLQTHYTSFFPLFSLFGAFFLVSASNYFKNEKNQKYLIISVLVIILLFNVHHIRGPLTSKTATDKVRQYLDKNADQNTLVVMDGRIYRATIIWMGDGTNYVEASYLGELFKASEQRQPIKTLFVECVTDDCGWGTIRDQPDFNKSMEEITSQFNNISTKKDSINGGGVIKDVRGFEEFEGKPTYRVYSTTLMLDPRVLQAVTQTHNHFFYHIPRDEFPEQAYDYYKVTGTMNNLFKIIAYIVLYLVLILAVLSMFVPFYILFGNENKLVKIVEKLSKTQ